MKTEIKNMGMCTTVHPVALPFAREWYASVLQQTDSDYQLWIALDELTPDDVIEKFGSAPRSVVWVCAEAGETPASIRQRVLSRIVEFCDGVILVDSDDILHPGRVAAARNTLRRCDMAGCALRLVDSKGRDQAMVLGSPSQRMPDGILPRHNIFGLSNTAWRSQTLQRCLPIPPNVEIVDWYLATRAWLIGAFIDFDPEVYMDYRQHSSNMVRVCAPFSREQVIGDTRRVLHHLNTVLAAPLDGRIHSRQKIIMQVIEDIECFIAKVIDKPAKLEEYIDLLNQLNTPPMWWSSVAHQTLKHLWAE